jgi:hypothetical protein
VPDVPVCGPGAEWGDASLDGEEHGEWVTWMEVERDADSVFNILVGARTIRGWAHLLTEPDRRQDAIKGIETHMTEIASILSEYKERHPE